MHPRFLEVRCNTTALCRTAVAVAGFVIAFQSQASPQYFGQNKVQHEQLQFAIIQTDHFDVYYYEDERAAAIDGARMAERAYARFARLLNHEYKQRQPLILFASHSEFQQNNVTTVAEGTGGVTEPYRHRILLPFTGSYGDFEHVLQHEVVHQFQFDIFARGVIGAGLPRLIDVNPPLWFMEGMAEYLSLGPVDAHTAMWLRDGVIHDRLPTIEQLTNDPSYTPYRYGHALWSYIADHWGDGAVAQLLHAAPVAGIEAAFRKVLGVSLQQLSQEWHRDVRRCYGQHATVAVTARQSAAAVLTRQRSDGTLHVSPAISPDGTEIAYLSEGSWYWIDLFLADAATGRVKRRLVKSAFSSEFESLRFLNSTAAWSPDGRLLAFAAKRGGSDDLVIYDVKRNEVLRRIELPLNGITTPTWSPDGERLVFTGYDGGLSDLFMVQVDGSDLTRLTDDRYADLHPAWSPDGNTIAFATDRGPDSDLAQLRLGKMQLATYDVATGAIEILPGMVGQNTNPQWAPDSKSLAFVSDRGGTYNIFLFDFQDATVYQLTNVVSGTAGITPLSPAISWATEADRLVFTYFEDSEFNVYALDEPRSHKRLPARDAGAVVVADVSEPFAVSGSGPLQEITITATGSYADGPRHDEDMALTSLAHTSLYRTGGSFRPSDSAPRETTAVALSRSADVQAAVDSVASQQLPAESDFRFKGYSPKLSIDYVIQPTIGYVRDNFGGGFFGGSAISLSDMLGNRRLLLAGMVNGRIDEAQVLATYANLGHRINWAVGVSQDPIFYYTGRSYVPGAAGNEAHTTRLDRIVMRQAFVQAFRPFNKFRRVELTLRAVNVTRSSVELTQVLDPESGIVVETDRTDRLLENTAYFQPSIALVFDNAASLWVGPFLGRRSRLEYAPAFGGWNFHQVLADFRRYDHLFGPFTFASRAMFYGRFGSDADKFPLFLGRTDLLRGYTSGSFRRGECHGNAAGAGGGCDAWSQLTGTRIGLLSGEIRTALPRLFSAPVPLPPIELAVFFDAGLAWDGNSAVVFKRSPTQQQNMAHYRAPLMSWGFSLRSNVLGYFIVRADFAQPISRDSQGFYWILSFGPTF